MQNYLVIGLMSGTSLDGVDLACCEFTENGSWSYRILHSVTVPYNDEWKELLSTVHTFPAEDFHRWHIAYGRFLGTLVKSFCAAHSIRPQFVASHGHTVFHQPSRGFTCQIGDGAALAVASGLPVVCDFRSTDVALGGQGAPLVPVGDKLLFKDYDYCLNLGGIANISFEENSRRVAFDICACNMVLNALAHRAGMSFDEGGALASTGTVRPDLLKRLGESDYYTQPYPKSLGREDVEESIFPMLDQPKIPTSDLLATYAEHIAIQTGRYLKSGKVLVTGGGAFNTDLVRRIRENSGADIVVPDKEIVNFKEALIFGFLGLLRRRNEINCLADVTGASRDSCGGAIYRP